MKESIAGRVSRIVSGSINALIDAVENTAPETVMEQAVRDIDAAIDEVRAELGKVIAAKHLANTRLMEENRKHEELAERIELAVREGRDDLAEAAIAHQIDIEAQVPVLEAAVTDGAGKEKELESYVGALQAKRREMQEALRQFRATQADAAAAGSPTAARSGQGVAGDVEKAQSAFDRVLEHATGVPAGTGAGAEAAKLAELEELARKNRVRERLAAVKAGSK
jgi:phage shock protein A